LARKRSTLIIKNYVNSILINEKILKIVQSDIPNWQAIMMMWSHKELDVLSAKDSPFDNPHTKNFYLENIASLVALRYASLEFNKLLDGLETTINIFGSYFLCTTDIDNKIFSIIFPRNEQITEATELFQKTANQIRDSMP